MYSQKATRSVLLRSNSFWIYKWASISVNAALKQSLQYVVSCLPCISIYGTLAWSSISRKDTSMFPSAEYQDFSQYLCYRSHTVCLLPSQIVRSTCLGGVTWVTKWTSSGDEHWASIIIRSYLLEVANSLLVAILIRKSSKSLLHCRLGTF